MTLVMSQQINVVLHERDKNAGDSAIFAKLIKLIKGGEKEGKAKVGVLVKEEQQGPFATGWKEAVEGAEIESVDIASPIGLVLAVKDEVSLHCDDEIMGVVRHLTDRWQWWR